MKTKFLVAVCAAVLLPGLASAADVTIRWGDVLPGNHAAVQMIDRVAKAVAEKTGGRVAIQAYPGGQLGGSRDMIEAVANGIQEMVTEGVANFGQWVPSIGIAEAPYVWRDAAHLVKTMDGPIGQEFNKQLIDKRGIRILGTTYYGSRQLTTTEKRIEKVADMAGFKLRVPENEVFLAMATAWGAKPTPMNFNELYLALKQNVVDGQENPLPTIEAGKFFEVQKYLVLTGHIITPRIVVISEKVWQKLPAADQAAVSAAVHDGVLWNNEQILAAEKSLRDKFVKAGMTVIEPNVKEFRDAVLSVVPKKFEAKWGAGMWEKIQAVK